MNPLQSEGELLLLLSSYRICLLCYWFLSPGWIEDGRGEMNGKTAHHLPRHVRSCTISAAYTAPTWLIALRLSLRSTNEALRTAGPRLVAADFAVDGSRLCFFGAKGIVGQRAAENAPALTNRLKIPLHRAWRPCESEMRFQMEIPGI